MITILAGLITVAILLLAGALVGLLPLLVGQHCGRPRLGKLGLTCCMYSGLIPGLHLLMAIVFVVTILVRKTDISQSGQSAAPSPARAAPAPRPVQGNTLYVTALSGPLRGQSYPLGPDGLRFGCDPSCAVRFPTGSAGVSRQHCCTRLGGYDLQIWRLLLKTRRCSPKKTERTENGKTRQPLLWGCRAETAGFAGL